MSNKMIKCAKCGEMYPEDFGACLCVLEAADKAEKKAKKKTVIPEPDLREDLRGQADQIHDILEDIGPLSYEELGDMLEPPVSPKRAARLVSQMIRDGVELKREGSPRKVSIG